MTDSNYGTFSLLLSLILIWEVSQTEGITLEGILPTISLMKTRLQYQDLHGAGY